MSTPELTVSGLSRPQQPWTLQLFPEGMRLTPQQGGHPSIHILRSELSTHVHLMDFGLARRTLFVRKPVKRNFKLDPATWPTLTAWVGREAHLRMALRHRLGWGVPAGVLMVLTSVPVPGNPEAGVQGVPFNALWAALGALLIAGAIVSRKWPHPVLFLLDSAWFAVIGATFVVRVIQGGSPLWLLLAALQLQLIWSGISLFRALSMAPATDGHRGPDAQPGAPP